MKHLHFQQPDFAEKIRELAASGAPNPEIEARAAEIIAAVRDRRDAALVELTARFDGWQPASPADFRVTETELTQAEKLVSDKFKKAARLAHKNIAAFAKRCLKKDFTTKNAQGGRVGEKYDPLQRVGIYIPGGTAPLASTVLMTVTLARAAGCPQIAVCTPARNSSASVPLANSEKSNQEGANGTLALPNRGEIAPEILFAAKLAGATEIYKLGGAQAIAALALGTDTVRPVAKIFGPGNAYVVAAKRLLFGYAAMDLLPGPSELLVIADKTADPSFIAADMLAQAEHGSGMERVWLVTDCPKCADAVEKEIVRQLDMNGGTGVPPVDSGVAALLRSADKNNSALHRSTATPTRIHFIQKSLANAAIIVAKDLRQAADIANDLAPEHLELMVAKPKPLLPRLKTAGAIFIGAFTPTVLGDYIAGTSHVLPTGGAGKSFSGLTVDQFLRKTSVVEYNAAALKKSLAAVRELASAEGLEAHKRSAEIRFEATNPRG
jgi:histidinol dehydrogenase